VKNLQVTIITPESVQEQFEADSLVVPLEDGYWGILPKHSNMVATLVKGKVKARTKGGEKVYEIPEGWIQVFHNRIIILTPSFALI